MIAAILAVFTTAALMGNEPPELITSFYSLAECQMAADNREVKEAARKAGVVALCLQLKAGV